MDMFTAFTIVVVVLLLALLLFKWAKVDTLEGKLLETEAENENLKRDNADLEDTVDGLEMSIIEERDANEELRKKVSSLETANSELGALIQDLTKPKSKANPAPAKAAPKPAKKKR